MLTNLISQGTFLIFKSYKFRIGQSKQKSILHYIQSLQYKYFKVSNNSYIFIVESYINNSQLLSKLIHEFESFSAI